MSNDTPRVAVITGASSGIGLEAAKALASQGWSIIGSGRNAARSADAEGAIRAVSTGGQVTMLLAELSLMAEADRLAGEIAHLTDRIHLLINNAGAMATEKVITKEGLEENFAANHLGPFLLTERLLPLLRRAAADAPAGGVRILNTASDASEMVPGLNLDDMQNLENYNIGLAYCSGKLANVLHTRGLARRLAGDGIVVHAMHPGTVDTNFFAHFDKEHLAQVVPNGMVTPAEGADTLIWLATAEEPGQSNGGYFHKRAPRTPHPLIDDDAFIDRFWEESKKLISSTGVQL